MCVMPLSCECAEWEGEGWAYIEPDEFSTLQKHRRQRCKSCKTIIEKGQVCLEFPRLRYPTEYELDKRIHTSEDTEIFLASYFLCESCGDQYYNLTAAGFCVRPDENIIELLKEYKQEYVTNT